MKEFAGLLPSLLTAASTAMPPNPERPMQARDCREALARVREAALGSPLISAEANNTVLLAAIADAERVCLGEASTQNNSPPPA